MRHGHRLRLAPRNAIMHAGMDQGIAEHDIVPQRQGGKKRDIGGKTAAEIDGFFGPEKRRRFRFQRLVLGVITAQQPGAAGTHRHPLMNGLCDCRLQARRFGKPEIIVGGEIDPLPGRKRTQARFAAKAGKLRLIGRERRNIHRQPPASEDCSSIGFRPSRRKSAVS